MHRCSFWWRYAFYLVWVGLFLLEKHHSIHRALPSTTGFHNKMPMLIHLYLLLWHTHYHHEEYHQCRFIRKHKAWNCQLISLVATEVTSKGFVSITFFCLLENFGVKTWTPNATGHWWVMQVAGLNGVDPEITSLPRRYTWTLLK